MVEAQIIVRRFIEAAEKFNEAYSMNDELTVKLEHMYMQRDVMSNCQSRLSSLYGGSEFEWLEVLWNCTEKMAQFDSKGDA